MSDVNPLQHSRDQLHPLSEDVFDNIDGERLYHWDGQITQSLINETTPRDDYLISHYGPADPDGEEYRHNYYPYRNPSLRDYVRAGRRFLFGLVGIGLVTVAGWRAVQQEFGDEGLGQPGIAAAQEAWRPSSDIEPSYPSQFSLLPQEQRQAQVSQLLTRVTAESESGLAGMAAVRRDATPQYRAARILITPDIAPHERQDSRTNPGIGRASLVDFEGKLWIMTVRRHAQAAGQQALRAYVPGVGDIMLAIREHDLTVISRNPEYRTEEDEVVLIPLSSDMQTLLDLHAQPNGEKTLQPLLLSPMAVAGYEYQMINESSGEYQPVHLYGFEMRNDTDTQRKQHSAWQVIAMSSNIGTDWMVEDDHITGREWIMAYDAVQNNIDTGRGDYLESQLLCSYASGAPILNDAGQVIAVFSTVTGQLQLDDNQGCGYMGWAQPIKVQ